MANLAVALSVSAGELAVQYRGSIPIVASSAVDQHGEPFTIRGLSGLSYVGEFGSPTGSSHRLVCVIDGSDKAIFLDVILSANGTVESVDVVGGLTLSAWHDHEGVAFAGTRSGAMLMCEEDTPAVREYVLSSGTELGSLPLPTVYANRRTNFGFESLAMRQPPAADGTVWTANEEALTNDGPVSSPTAGTRVRVQRFDGGVGAWTIGGQWAYGVDAMHGSLITGARSGLVELVSLPDGRLLALERSFAFNLGGFFRSRLYEIDFEGASDVSTIASLNEAGVVQVSKRLLWQANAENLEGMSLGPLLADGSRSLVGVVDDGDPISTNKLVVLALTGVIEPRLADVGWDGCVDLVDLLSFLELWIQSLGAATGQGDLADFNQDGVVDLVDLLDFLAPWLMDVGVCDR